MKNKNLRYRRRYYHNSPKAGTIYCQSSYEIKAALILDEDNDVVTYKSQIPFKNHLNKKRFSDFLVTYQNSIQKIIEVKPGKRVEAFESQIGDNQKHAKANNYLFEVWTEKELGFKSDYFATKWADEYLSKIDKVDYTDLRKDRHNSQAKKHYVNNISQNKITVFCEFCKEDHIQLQLTYNKNVNKNGRFICIKENGHIIGKRDKTHLKNPLEAEGKKKCNGPCGKTLSLDQFSPNGKDKEGKVKHSSQCKKCRAEKHKEKYNNE